MSTDPIGDGLNFYAYCFADPINWMDPEGLCVVKDLPLLPDSWVDFSAGFGDVLLLGFGDDLRAMLDIGSVDTNSGFYKAGKYSGYACEVAMGAAMLAKAGYQLVFRAYPNAGGGGITLLKDGGRVISADWHRFMLKGKEVFRPHLDIKGIAKHWPWR